MMHIISVCSSVFYSPIPADVLSMANFTLEFTTPFLDFSDSVVQTQQCTYDSSVIKRVPLQQKKV